MRILHVSPYFSDAWGYGGIPRVAAALSEGLAGLGHQVTVCTTDACDEGRRLPSGTFRTAGGVDVRVFRNLSNALAYRRQLFLPEGLDRYLRSHAREFDVAHLHACRNVPGMLAARYLRAANVPYVLMPNGTAPVMERQQAAKRIFDLLFGDEIVAGAVRVIAVSKAEQSQLEKLGVDPRRISLLPNPIDLTEFERPTCRGRFLSEHRIQGRPVVMFLGRITPRKNLDVLLRAFARLNRDGAVLVVAGNHPGRTAAVQKLASVLGIADRIRFVGQLQGRQRLEALGDADVVVYPSQDEVFGLVPLEALLAGSPVVVSDDSGCGEIISDVGGGRTSPVGDVERLAQVIDAVLDDPDARERTADAARRIRRDFDSRAVCARLEQIYGSFKRAA